MFDINKIRELCALGRVKWTLHALSRIRERDISAGAVTGAVKNGVEVMHYHDDKPFPSWLMYNGDKDKPLHVAVSTDGDKIIIITAYIPTGAEWEDDWITRKE